MNNANIEPYKITSTEEAREKGRSGGIASGKARQERAQLRECLKILLELDSKELDEYGNAYTGAERLAVKVFNAALSGDWKAWELVRDTAGQKPPQTVAATVKAGINPEIIAEVEQMLDSI